MVYVGANQIGNPPITNLQGKIKATSSTGAVLEQTSLLLIHSYQDYKLKNFLIKV